MTWLERKVPPAITMALCIAATYGSTHFTPSLSINWAGQKLIATAIACFAILLIGWCGITFRKAKTTVNPVDFSGTEQLVIEGAYRLSRNPIYLAMALIILAAGIWLGHITALLWLLAFIFYMNRFQIRPEERFLNQKFGDSYQNYCAKVRRWL